MGLKYVPQKTELILEVIVETAELVVAAAADFIVIQHEQLARFGDDRAEADLERLLAHEAFGHDVLDRLAICGCPAEDAVRHTTNPIPLAAGSSFLRVIPGYSSLFVRILALNAPDFRPEF